MIYPIRIYIIFAIAQYTIYIIYNINNYNLLKFKVGFKKLLTDLIINVIMILLKIFSLI